MDLDSDLEEMMTPRPTNNNNDNNDSDILLDDDEFANSSSVLKKNPTLDLDPISDNNNSPTGGGGGHRDPAAGVMVFDNDDPTALPPPSSAHLQQSGEQHQQPIPEGYSPTDYNIPEPPSYLPPDPNLYNSILSPSKSGGIIKDKISAKSLFFCLTVDNPFFKDFVKESAVHESRIVPNAAGTPKAHMNDELLCTDRNDPNTSANEKGDVCTLRRILDVGALDPVFVPNRFQKLIEILIRLKMRDIDVQPEGMLEAVASPEAVPSTEGGANNYYRGFRLVKSKIFTSPDEDEINIKVHASKRVMTDFAESRGMVFSSHIYSFGGGRPMVYSTKMEEDLEESVEQLFIQFPKVANTHYRERGLEGIPDDEGAMPEPSEAVPDAPLMDQHTTAAKLEREKKKLRSGFNIRNTEKQRIMNRMLRDPWQFGGCGIQIDEMVKKRVLVRHFFPLHNNVAMEARGLIEWGQLQTAFQKNPLKQNVENVMDYFGEEVALYSYWMALYTKYLIVLAVAGFCCGIAGQVATSQKALISAIFACICVVWGVGWNVLWNQREAYFGAHYALDALEDQQTIRDTYESVEEIDIDDDKLHLLEFTYPPSLVSTSDGKLVEMHYPPLKRLLTRYLFSYPVIILLTGFMVGLQCLITAWRLDSPDDLVVNYGSSFLALTLSASFDVCFTKVIDMVNALENNRTDNEEEFQTIMKRFFYYFFSKYFAVYSILLWPKDELSDSDRLDTIEIQMLTTTVILPLVQNVTETFLPMLKARFRINYDMSQSYTKAVMNTLMGRTHKHYPKCAHMDEDAEILWLESQREPLLSMGDDYLEILLQYGFMSMFAVTFPFAAVAAFVYNLFEIRVDANKMIRFYQRPYARPISTIGAWKVLFGFIAVLAVVSNSFIISLMTTAVEEVGAGSLTPERRYQFFVGFQYVLGAMAVLVYVLVPSKPSNYLKMRVKQSVLATRFALRSAELRRRKDMEDTLV